MCVGECRHEVFWRCYKNLLEMNACSSHAAPQTVPVDMLVRTETSVCSTEVVRCWGWNDDSYIFVCSSWPSSQWLSCLQRTIIISGPGRRKWTWMPKVDRTQHISPGMFSTFPLEPDSTSQLVAQQIMSRWNWQGNIMVRGYYPSLIQILVPNQIWWSRMFTSHTGS